MRKFDPSQLPEPRDLPDLVLSDLPLDIEIGAGTGAFAIDYAQTNPHRHLIAIEHTRTKFARFEAELSQLKALTNLTAIHANGISWVSQQLGPSSVEQYFFMYPNPNPKKKHQNKRWHAMPFMERVIWTLKPGGQITTVTNEEWYIQEAKEFFIKEWGLSVTEEFSFTSETLPFSKPRTLFEKKYLERGETCHQLVVSRKNK